MKYRPSILKTIPEELRLKVDEQLKEFTEEIIKENPRYVADCRIEFLQNQIDSLVFEANLWGLRSYHWEDWFRDIILDTVVKPIKKEIKKLQQEINFYKNVKPINYDTKITEEDIERARTRNCMDLIDIKRITGKIGLAICPFHNDKNPSLNV